MGKGGKAKSSGVDLNRMSEDELREHAVYYNAGIAGRVKKMVGAYQRSPVTSSISPSIGHMYFHVPLTSYHLIIVFVRLHYSISLISFPFLYRIAPI